MKTSLKVCGWLLLAGVVAYLAVAFAASADYGQFNVTINGKKVEGVPKYLIGSAGMLAGGVIALIAVVVAVFFVAGSGFFLFAVMGFVGLVMLTVALPFLLPAIVPVVVVLAVVLALRQTKAKKVGSTEPKQQISV